MENILVGKVAKPQGIRGELKVIPMTDTPEIFLSLKTLYIDGTEYKVVSSRAADGVYVLLSGVADRNAAETFRDKNIFAPKNDIPLPEGRWFLSDIIGSKILLNTGDFIGTVTDVTKRGSTDIFTARGGGWTAFFPFLKDMIVSVNTDEKRIILDKKRFDEVAFYEN